MVDRPNVVVFLTDQQRFDSAGLHGNPLDLMPNFDRIAHEGTHLPLLMSPQPVCTPARACLQTGRYATAVNVWKNGLPLPDDYPTLATCFNDAGYHTAYFGKWHLSKVEGVKGPVPAHRRGGYQHWLGADSLEFVSEPYCCRVYDNDENEVILPGYRVDAITNAAIQHIDRVKDQPFMVFIGQLEPHAQNSYGASVAPTGYAQRYENRWIPPDLTAFKSNRHWEMQTPIGGEVAGNLGDYWGCCKRLDESFGQLRDALRSMNLHENTIVVFASDHGSQFATRNWDGKCSCHDVSARVPGAIWGGPFLGGGSVRQPVSLVDLAPTLLDACGVTPPETMQGRSFFPLLGGRTDPAFDEAFIQISQAEVGRAVRTLNWKYGVVGIDAEGKELDGLKHAASEVYREAYLYDLMNDPYEIKNLVGMDSHREVADGMRERLLRRMAAAGETQPRIIPADPRTGGQRRVPQARIHA